MTDMNAKKQKGSLYRLCVIYILADILALVSVAAMLFTPMYRADYSVGEYVINKINNVSMEGVEVIDLESGDIVKTFSIYDDFTRAVRHMCRGEANEPASFVNFFKNFGDNAGFFFTEVFPIIALFALLIFLALTALSSLIDIIVTLLTPGDRMKNLGLTVKGYAEGEGKRALGFLYSVPVLSLFFMLFDFLWVQGFGLLSDDLGIRHTAGIRGVNMLFAIPFVIAAVYFLLYIIKRRGSLSYLTSEK